MIPNRTVWAADTDYSLIDIFDTKTMILGKTGIHTNKIPGEYFGLIPSGGTAYFDNSWGVVEVFANFLHLRLGNLDGEEIFELGLEPGHFRSGKRTEFRVGGKSFVLFNLSLNPLNFCLNIRIIHLL